MTSAPEALRVVVVGPAPPLRGGIAQHTAGMTAALRARGHRVRVLSYRRLYPRVLFPGRSEHEPGHERSGGPASGGDGGDAALDTLAPATWLRSRTELAAARPDLVVLQWWHPIAAPALAAVAAAARCPVVVVCHNATPHEAFPAAPVLARLVLARARAAICHSRAVARSVGRLAPSLPFTVVPMPVLIAPRARRETVACRRGVPCEAPARGNRCASSAGVLFLGVVRPYKGIDVLLEAWRDARLPEHATLTIAGESYLGTGRLQRMVAACGPRAAPIRVVDAYVPDEDVVALLGGAAVLVLPYRAASQSGVLPIGVAAGLRVVASDAGGLAEALEGDPRHAVFRAGDAAALRHALQAAVEAQVRERAGEGPGDAARRARQGLAHAAAVSWWPLISAIESAAAR